MRENAEYVKEGFTHAKYIWKYVQDTENTTRFKVANVRDWRIKPTGQLYDTAFSVCSSHVPFLTYS